MPYVPTLEDLDLNIDELLELVEKHEAKKKWDRELTYVIDIIKGLHGRKWGVRKVYLDAQLLEKRTADREPIPKEFGKTIQSILNSYTSQSSVFRKAGKGPEDDLFYSPIF